MKCQRIIAKKKGFNIKCGKDEPAMQMFNYKGLNVCPFCYNELAQEEFLSEKSTYERGALNGAISDICK